MHAGDDLSDGTKVHYTAWIKRQNLLCMDDQDVSAKQKWPANSYIKEGSQSPRALFYERC